MMCNDGVLERHGYRRGQPVMFSHRGIVHHGRIRRLCVTKAVIRFFSFDGSPISKYISYNQILTPRAK